MVKLREINGAKVWQQDWAKLQGFSTEEQCYSLSERDINLLLSFVAYQASWSSRWGGYEDFADVREYVAGLVNRLLLPADVCAGSDSGGGGGGVGAGGRLDFFESEGQMAGIGIVRIGGKAYLAQDCGCSDTALFELTPMSVTTGGGLVAAGSGGGTDVPSGGFNYPEPSVDCYAEKAVDYLFMRALEYAELIIDATALGVDAILGDLDEWVNGATIVADVLFGTNSTREIAQVGVDAFQAALTDSTVKAAFVAAWQATGAVGRDDLRAWINRANTDYKIGGTLPIKTYLQSWLNGSVMLGYNNDLNRIAASCSSGVGLGGTATIGSNVDFIAYRVSFPTPQQYILDKDIWTTIVTLPEAVNLAYFPMTSVNNVGTTLAGGRVLPQETIGWFAGFRGWTIYPTDYVGARAYLELLLNITIGDDGFNSPTPQAPAGEVQLLNTASAAPIVQLSEYYYVVRRAT